MWTTPQSYLSRKAPILHGVRKVSRAARRAYGGMEPDPRHAMTPTQAFYLSNVIARRGLTVTELAELTHVTLAAASQMVDRLVGRGFARRRASAMDARCVMVEATAHGAWALQLSASAVRDAERQWRKGLGGDRPSARMREALDTAERSQYASIRRPLTPSEARWLGHDAYPSPARAHGNPPGQSYGVGFLSS